MNRHEPHDCHEYIVDRLIWSLNWCLICDFDLIIFHFMLIWWYAVGLGVGGDECHEDILINWFDLLIDDMWIDLIIFNLIFWWRIMWRWRWMDLRRLLTLFNLLSIQWQWKPHQKRKSSRFLFFEKDIPVFGQMFSDNFDRARQKCYQMRKINKHLKKGEVSRVGQLVPAHPQHREDQPIYKDQEVSQTVLLCSVVSRLSSEVWRRARLTSQHVWPKNHNKIELLL